MFQMIFNEISAAEMAALPKELQLDLLAEFQVFPDNTTDLDGDRFGKVQRAGRTLLRYRAKDYRIYFERNEQGLVVHRVLHRNTIRDFLYRSNLPLVEEDEALAEAKGFWHLIEEAEKQR